MNLKHYLILLTAVLMMSCAQTSALIHEQRMTLASATLLVKVFDRGKRMSTRHAMITVENQGKDSVTAVYTVTITGQHNGAINLKILISEASLDLQDNIDMQDNGGELGRAGRQAQADFIINLSLPAEQTHQFYLDTSYNSEKEIRVETVTVRKNMPGKSKISVTAVKKNHPRPGI